MVGSKIICGQKVGSQYPISNIGDCKFESKLSFTNGDGAGKGAVASDVRTICCAQLSARRSSTALLRCGRDDRQKSAAVHQPLFISTGICDVKEEIVFVVADDVVHDSYIVGLPFGGLC